MHKFLLVPFLLLIGCCVHFTRHPTDLISEVKPALVHLTRVTPEGTSSCSGSFIGERIILTAAHCVDPDAMPIATDSNGKRQETTPIAINETKDIAIISVPEPGPDSLSLGDEPNLGERLLIMGFPGYAELRFRCEITYLQAVEELFKTRMLVGDKAYPGHSGGPVVDERGFVVGIVSRGGSAIWFGSFPYHQHKDVGLYVSVQEIKTLLDMLKSKGLLQ